jgi:hypothetical protein
VSAMAQHHGSCPSSISNIPSQSSDSSQEDLSCNAVDPAIGTLGDLASPHTAYFDHPSTPLPLHLLSACSTAGRNMCAFSKSITSKDISHAVRGLKGMYKAEPSWLPMHAKEAPRQLPEQRQQFGPGHVLFTSRLGESEEGSSWQGGMG